MVKKKILNLYAGIGGNRKNWNDEDYEITAVEYSKELAEVYKKYFPKDKVIIADAEDFLINNWKDYDFIWASPPCQTHSQMRFMASKRGDYAAKLPDLNLYSIILFLKHFCKDKKWVVENVKPYYEPIIKPTIKLQRHLFWANFPISDKEIEKSNIKHNKVTGLTEKYGFSLVGTKLKQRKDQVIRNCVNPLLADHIIKEAFKNEN